MRIQLTEYFQQCFPVHVYYGATLCDTWCAIYVGYSIFLMHINSSHYFVSNDGPHNGCDTYDDGQDSKGDGGPIDCIASGRRVLFPLSTLWSAHSRTVVKEEILRALYVDVCYIHQ